MPPWPMAMPSSTAIVLNSRGMAPAALTASETTRPTSCRWTWPGTNSVKLLATATIGLRPAAARAEFVQLAVAGQELGEAVGHGDDRLPPDVLTGNTRAPDQGPGARHVSA